MIANREQIPQELYGAKAANLSKIEPVLESLRNDNIECGNVGIPEFVAIPVSLYDSWKMGRTETGEISDSYRWMKDQKYPGDFIVRSSAVLSEDGDSHMAAGLYESIVIPSGVNSVGYFEAVKKVFESLSTDASKAYMDSIGIDPDQEKMGLILQKVPLGVNQFITCDTVTPGNTRILKGSCRFVLEDEEDEFRHLSLNRTGLKETSEENPHFLAQSPTSSVYHIPPDFNKIPYGSAAAIIRSGVVSLAIEDYFGRPVQTELVRGEYDWDDESTDTSLSIVQARPLPESLVYDEEFDGFPDEEKVIYRGRGSKTINGMEANFSEWRGYFGNEWLYLNSSKYDLSKGLILTLPSSTAMHGRLGDIYKSVSKLSKEERSNLVFLITEKAEGWEAGASGGHVETLCMEMGIACIFYDPGNTTYPQSQVQPSGSAKVYSDGVEARIYRAK